jgi:hypothetical protein
VRVGGLSIANVAEVNVSFWNPYTGGKAVVESAQERHVVLIPAAVVSVVRRVAALVGLLSVEM